VRAPAPPVCREDEYREPLVRTSLRRFSGVAPFSGSQDAGHPKLREHPAGVLMLMKYSPNWQVSMDRLDREFPGKQFNASFPDDYQPADGEAPN
jgi:hypothetical protein